ncbi:hypothetical protein BDZ94DRAFT_1297750 [Collybia nuda]|uniref:Uncharacterized protein n=1 Tax=Collybia nuda TaxID=64659 RepID=A0A9P5Y6F5_9AGAR|nr:hypothetical protein BDZ94DRAFT_1297750 [Collybia nuda]
MSNGSPTAYLLWAILSCIFLAFLVLHLWSYDKFKCLKWGSGRQPGAFKRVMTYSYLGTVPMLVIFSVAITVIKFKEGFIVTPRGHIIPRPFSLWGYGNRRWLVPLYFLLSIAWSLELVTHLEELTFWLFLLHQGPGKREWFQSWEFRTWYLGSVAAVIGMPVTTLVTRRDIDTCLAWIFLVGSSAGTFTTILFLYVLARFPGFIRHVKSEGAEPDVVVRLATFYQLNRIRVMFRFLFTLPLLIIAVDGIDGSSHPIVNDPFALDFMLMMGGIGCFISSAITLLIFFPRSITRESGYKAKASSPNSSKTPPTSPLPNYYHHHHDRGPSSPKSAYIQNTIPEIRMSSFRFPDSPSPHPFHALDNQSRPRVGRRNSTESDLSPGYESDAESVALSSHLPSLHTMPANLEAIHPTSTSKSAAPSDDTVWERDQENAVYKRRRHSDGPFFYDRRENTVDPRLTSPSTLETGRAVPSSSQLHPYVMNFTSPIDLMDAHRSS